MQVDSEYDPPMAGLVSLPPEVMAVVCRHLSSTSLAALDCTCTSLHWTLARWPLHLHLHLHLHLAGVSFFSSRTFCNILLLIQTKLKLILIVYQNENIVYFSIVHMFHYFSLNKQLIFLLCLYKICLGRFCCQV